MEPDCERWAAWFDAKALEEPASQAETLWAKQHQLGCAHCAAEARFYGALLQPSHVPTSPAALALAQQALAHARPPRRFRAIAVAGFAAAAAVLLGVFWLRANAAELSLKVRSASGARVDGREARDSEALDRGAWLVAAEQPVTLETSTGVELTLAPHGRLQLATDSGPERTVRLGAGSVRLALARQPAGTRFGVETDDGVALAMGTVFSVARLDGETRVDVEEGRVLVRDRTGRAVEVPSAHWVDVRQLEVRAQEQSPQAAAQAPPTPALEEKVAEAVVPPPRRIAPPPRVKPTVAPAAPPLERAAEKLREARSLRAEKRFADAIATYEEVLATWPGTEEALAARLALAQVELKATGHPKRALLEFQRYLEAAGPLRDEAAAGRIEALEALGRADEARAAAAAFLTQFPTSVRVDEMRARVDAGPGVGQRRLPRSPLRQRPAFSKSAHRR
jgi:ferric-dicitrate binding protein FerR (iron transport regulator)